MRRIGMRNRCCGTLSFLCVTVYIFLHFLLSFIMLNIVMSVYTLGGDYCFLHEKQKQVLKQMTRQHVR